MGQGLAHSGTIIYNIGQVSVGANIFHAVIYTEQAPSFLID